MNEKDLRDAFAMFALAGAVMSGRTRSAEDIWKLADEMLEARDKEPEQEVGIVAAKSRRKKND